MRIHFTDIVAKNLPHADGQKTAWDTHTFGLGLRIGKHRKTWIVMLGRKRKRVTLGHYPQMTLKEARQVALRHKLKTSDDSPTFRETVDRFINLHLQPNTKPSSAKVIEALLRRHFSHFANRRVSDISARDVTLYLNTINDTPAEANQAHRAIKLIFNWAAAQHLIEISPLIHTKPPHKSNERDRVLSDDELRAVLTWNGIPQFQTMLRLLAHTAQRRQQIGGLKWTNIQGSALHWTKEEMKANRPHTIPITPAVAALLDQPRSFTYVFAVQRPFSNWSKHLQKLRGETNVEHFTVHDIRRTTATNMRRLGIPSATVEVLLHHTKPKVAGIYDRYTPLKEMEEAMLRHDAWLNDLIKT